jgi:hypothetical protein
MLISSREGGAGLYEAAQSFKLKYAMRVALSVLLFSCNSNILSFFVASFFFFFFTSVLPPSSLRSLLYFSRALASTAASRLLYRRFILAVIASAHPVCVCVCVFPIVLNGRCIV